QIRKLQKMFDCHNENGGEVGACRRFVLTASIIREFTPKNYAGPGEGRYRGRSEADARPIIADFRCLRMNRRGSRRGLLSTCPVSDGGRGRNAGPRPAAVVSTASATIRAAIAGTTHAALG